MYNAFDLEQCKASLCYMIQLECQHFCYLYDIIVFITFIDLFQLYHLLKRRKESERKFEQHSKKHTCI
jgi:hypothetical protein